MARTQSFRSRLVNLVGIVGAAVDVAAATDARRKPAARSLDALGIDPAAFERIRR